MIGRPDVLAQIWRVGRWPERHQRIWSGAVVAVTWACVAGTQRDSNPCRHLERVRRAQPARAGQTRPRLSHSLATASGNQCARVVTRSGMDLARPLWHSEGVRGRTCPTVGLQIGRGEGTVAVQVDPPPTPIGSWRV
jgi:hypothetical protein